MRRLKWYHILLLFLGGFIFLLAGYLVLRATGMFYRLTPRSRRWIDYEE